MGIWKELGMASGQGAIGSAIGLLTGGIENNRQYRQEKRLQKLHIKGQKEMADYNAQLALQNWQNTSYPAQVNMMKKAGLNVGLMYEGGGAGGTLQQPSGGTGGSHGANVQQSVGMGLNLAMQAAMMKAQIANTEADTKLKEVEATKKQGADTEEVKQRIAESGARMQEIAARVKNAETQNDILQYEREIKQVEAKFAEANNETSLEQTKAAISKLVADTKNAELANKIDSATANEVIKQATLQSVTMYLSNDLLKQKIIGEAANTTETYRKIEKIAEEIIRMQAQTEQGETGLNQEQQRILLERMKTDFSAGDEARLIRWIETAGDAAGKIISALPKNAAKR